MCDKNENVSCEEKLAKLKQQIDDFKNGMMFLKGMGTTHVEVKGVINQIDTLLINFME